MKLIIAEKPSLGRNIIAGINGTMTKKDGYYEGNEYIVTWAFGHLFSLEDIEHYSPSEDGRWSLKNIPCFPEKFDFTLRHEKNGKVDGGVKKQFEIIKHLCNRPDVDTIINAGDADREGEIIVRLCVAYALTSQKKLVRLWLNDQTPETVAKGLNDLKDEKEYLNLASEGMARTYIDWLYGVNLTRYATLRSGSLLRVGRVIVPIVRAIYERDLSIESFVPEDYFVPYSNEETNGEKIELTGKAKFSKDEKARCQELCDKYNSLPAVVTSVSKKRTTLFPGKLYSLSTLQSFLGKKYKMSMSKSLEIIQGLYEKGFLTYPRTNSEYMATAEKGKVRQIIEIAKKMGYPLKFKDNKTIFDDSKIESHSAITPTTKTPKKEALSPDELTVYSTVFRRFAAVFCAEDCIVDRTEIKINVGNEEEFVLKGAVMVEKGWTKYDDYSGKDKILPMLNKGDAVNINFTPCAKKTTPPKHYTIETLNNYLKNPFKEEKAKAEDEKTDDSEDYKAIFEGLELGTEATRTGIIDNARNSGYISLKKDTYYIEQGGRRLIETLDALCINMDKFKTAEVGKALKRVYRGEATVRESLQIAKDEISEAFKPLTPDKDIGYFREEIGVCPLCGKKVTRSPFSYGCEGYKEGCKFNIPLYLLGKAVPKTAAIDLLTKGQTSVLDGFVSKKTGNKFSASLKLDENKKTVFVF